MTYAPRSYLDARQYLIDELDMHPGRVVPDDLDPAEVGIVGGPSHVATGTSYHLGLDDLKLWRNPYSCRLPRDRAAATNGASATDLGEFRKTLPNGRVITHRTLGTWLVAQCQAGAPDAAWIREVIWSPDGRTVLRYDRERGQASAPRAGEADDSHLTHDHVSGYRDQESTPKQPLFQRFLHEMSGDDDMTPDELMAHKLSSPALGVTDRPFADWIKAGAGAERAIAALRAEARLRDEAILAAVRDDADRDAILARVDQRATALEQRLAGIVPAVLAALPAGADPVSRDELVDALRAVLGSLDDPAPAQG